MFFFLKYFEVNKYGLRIKTSTFCSWCDQMILCMKNDHVVRSVPQPCCISVQAFPRGRSKEHLKQFYYNSKFGDFSIFNTRWAHVLYNLLECKMKHVYMSLWYVPSILELERLWTGRHPFKLAQPLKSTTKAQHASRSRTMKCAISRFLQWFATVQKILSDFGASPFFFRGMEDSGTIVS